jgi:glycosyltransferase involved in cell wall biosynthesis
MHLLPEALRILVATGQVPAPTKAMRLIILGEVSDAGSLLALENSISNYGLAGIVQYYRETQQPEAYYHAADIVILFSPAEGMPNVALEALAAGRPVIISEAANAAGIVDHGVTGWVVPTGDTDALRRAQEFSISRMVNAYEQLYLELTS